jgi:hypothetical protein
MRFPLSRKMRLQSWRVLSSESVGFKTRQTAGQNSYILGAAGMPQRLTRQDTAPAAPKAPSWGRFFDNAKRHQTRVKSADCPFIPDG